MAPRWMTANVETILKDRPIVLVDVGASGGPPKSWRSISGLSYYVGFDPDKRDFEESNPFGFSRCATIPKAVTDGGDSVDFYLTKSPHCSSVLKPNQKNLGEYSFSELFITEETVTVPAVTIGGALRQIGLEYIDWLKLDTQGRDTDIYFSIEEPVRSRIIVLDIEPGATNFYEGENTFADSHNRLLNDELWLAALKLQQHPRVASSTRKTLASSGIAFDQLPGSPTAFEATYIRTREAQRQRSFSERDLCCSWVLSMLLGKYGFAMDIVAEMMGHPEMRGLADELLELTLLEVRKTRSWRNTLRSSAPSLYRLGKKMIGR